MHRDEVKCLYYITAQSNVVSILEHGILCHRRAAELRHSDISMPSVQDIRARKQVPGGLLLHEYANLYFWPRNPMLYLRSLDTPSTDLCVLVVDHRVMDLPDVVIADHNAAAGIASFGPYPEGLEAVDRDLTFAQWWKHEDPFEEYRHKKRMCAEVLVPGHVPPDLILGACVRDDAAKQALEARGATCRIRVYPRIFF
jgi:ssDNA thymidine ADP-ribosyltransferase, DarT